MKTKAKSLSVIRIVVLENPETKRKVLERVTRDGKLSKRAAAKLGVKKVASWLEVEAKSWKAASRAVRAGKGKKVAVRSNRFTDWNATNLTKRRKGGSK